MVRIGEFLLWCSGLMIQLVLVVISSPAQWVKDPALLQLWHRSKLRLRFDPWPGNSIGLGGGLKKNGDDGKFCIMYILPQLNIF